MILTKERKRRTPTRQDWLMSSTMLDAALQSIENKIKINRKYDVPYVAGYSENGKTIYIDRHLPKVLKINNKKVPIDRYLIMHEAVEKTLIDQLGLHYQFAHQIALRVEEAAVRADKVSWREYNNQLMKYIKKIGDENLTRLPKNLDLKPYHDEHDTTLLKRMQKLIAKK